MTIHHEGSRYSHREEMANSIIHGAGILLAIAGLVVLVVYAVRYGSAWHIASCSVFGASLIFLYTASTLYHSIPQPRAKAFLRFLDHSAIYLLIAGSYTPFTLVNLRGPWGWFLFGLVWGLAGLGIVLRVSLRGKFVPASVALYVAMGWAALLAIGPLISSIAPGGLILLLLGGIAYTAGILFYSWRRLPYNHSIWHVFVLAGSALHFFAVLFFVVPIPAIK
jgi:hemolysin III